MLKTIATILKMTTKKQERLFFKIVAEKIMTILKRLLETVGLILKTAAKIITATFKAASRDSNDNFKNRC